MRLVKKKVILNEVFLEECGGYRQNCRSVCWNSTGTRLAFASYYDRLAKIYSFDGCNNKGREVSALQGHTGGVERVRFHPHEHSLLCSSAEDRSVRLWDVRISSKACRSFSKISLISTKGSCAASVEWQMGGINNPWYLCISEKNNSVYIYDIRKIHSSTNSLSSRLASSSGSMAKPVRSFNLDPHILQECHFTPSGTHMIAATKSSEDGMGTLRVFPWDRPLPQGDFLSNHSFSPSYNNIFVGHTGPIYTIRFSPDGLKLATGGNDALVGLWDVPSMVCEAVISRRTKFIRSVSYSYNSKIVACCSEEHGIDLADSKTGEHIGTVSLSLSKALQNSFRFAPPGGGGSDEIAFHPKDYILACARGDTTSSGPQVPQVSVAKLNISLKY